MTEPNVRPPSFVRRHLATNLESDDTLVGLACDDNMWVRREAVKNPATPRWILDLLQRAGADPDLRGRRAPDPDMPAAELRRLVECGPWAQQLVADHPNTGSEILDVLAAQPSARLRLAVAGHANAAPSTLTRLCLDIDDAIRRRAAAHPSCPAEVLDIARRAGADEVLSGVTFPIDDPLGADDLVAVAALGAWGRFLAGRLAACPSGTLAEVAADPDWRVRSAVLDNPTAADQLVGGVAGLDPGAAVEHLRALSDRAASPSRLDALVDDAQPEVRLAVARHPRASVDTIGRLAVDRVPEVRRQAVGHPCMDRSLHELLVRAGSTDDLAQLAAPDPSITVVELGELSRGGYWARQLAVRHPDTPPELLAHLLCDEDPKLREWAAAHPATPPPTIEQLRRAGAAHDLQGIAPADADVSADELRRVADLGPYGRMIVSWHPNAPDDLRRGPG